MLASMLQYLTSTIPLHILSHQGEGIRHPLFVCRPALPGVNLKRRDRGYLTHTPSCAGHL